MAIELEGLEFQITSSSTKAEKGLKGLHDTLVRIRNATKGGIGLGRVANQIDKAADSVNRIDTDKLERLAKACEAIKNIKGPTSLARGFERMADATAKIDVERLERLRDALQGMNGIRLPRFPTMGGNGAAPAGDTPATPVDSAVENVGGQVEEATDRASKLRGVLTRLKEQFSEFKGENALKEQISQIDLLRMKIRGATAELERAKAGSKNGIVNYTSIANATERLQNLQNQLRELTMQSNVFHKLFTVGAGALKSMGNAAKSGANKVKELVKQSALLPVTLGSKMASSVQTFTGKIKETVKALGRIAFYRAIRTVLKEISQGFSEGIKNLYHYSETMNGTFYQSMNKLATSAQYLHNSLGAMASPLINALAPVIDFVTDKLVDLFNLFNQFVSKLTGQTTYTAAKKVAALWDDTKKKAKKATDEIKRYTLGFDELNILGKKDKDTDSSSKDSTDYGSMFETRKIDSGIADFADRIKELFVNQDWKGLGTLLGDKFNEAIDSIDWSGIGSKIGTWINGAIQTAYWLLDTINFTKIGSHIAEFLNNAISKIDFGYLGRLLVKRMTILPDMVIGFFTTFDWGQAASAFSDFVKGIYDEATKWFNSHDWSNLGKVLWQKIKDVFKNLDYAGIARSFFTMLGTAIRSAAQFLGGFFGSIGNDIKAWWNKDIQGKDWKETAGNLLTAIGKGFKNIGTWVFNNIIDPFGKALLGEKWENIKSVPTKVWAKIKEGWAEITNKVVTFGATVKNTATTWWTNVKTWWSEKVGAVQEFTTNVKNNVSTWWANVNVWWNEKVGAVREFTTDVKNTAVSWWSKVKVWWAGKVGAVKEFTVNARNTAGVWWADVKAWWKKVIEPNTISTFVVNAKNTASTWWTNVKTWWKNTIDPTSAQNFIVNAKNTASTWWSDVKEYWSNYVSSWRTLEVVASIRNNVSTLWSNIQTWWDNTVGDLWTTLQIRLPRISVRWQDWFSVFGQNIQYPVFDVYWNAKGGILDDPLLFGMMGKNILGGGEAGREAVLPLETHTEWMDTLADKVRAGLPGMDEDLTESVRQGMSEATARQNDLLREQNSLLRQILDKDLTANVSFDDFTKAAQRKNRIYGTTVVPIG